MQKVILVLFAVLGLTLATTPAMAQGVVENEGEIESQEIEVVGNHNKTVVIEELTININLSDVMMTENDGGDAEGILMRLLDMLGMLHQQSGGFGSGHGMGMGGMDMPHKPMDMPHPPMDGMHPQMEGHPGMPGMPMMRMDMEGHPGMGGMHPDMGGMHGMGMGGMMLPPDHPGMGPREMELMQLMHEIPADVDPGFVRFIFHIGALAWEHPELREHLEQLVQRVEGRDTDREVRRDDGRKDGPFHRDGGERRPRSSQKYER